MRTTDLRQLLYGNSDPYSTWPCRTEFPTYDRYLHTHITEEVIDHLLDTCPEGLWLEVGSMYGGSAIKAAEMMRLRETKRPILCVDPFCGDVSMWEINAADPELLDCEGSRVTILDKFIGNVISAGFQDAITPLPVTGTIGMRLLERFIEDGKIDKGPSVIYLDSAHEWEETYIELKTAWRILDNGGCIAGDDLDWPAVKHDLRKFSQEIGVSIEERSGGQWMVRKPIDHPHIPSPFFISQLESKPDEHTEQHPTQIDHIFSTNKEEIKIRNFDLVYEKKLWGWQGNGSGTGSMMHTTVAARELFERLITDHGVRIIVDASVGGMEWWPEVLEKHPEVKFYGYDISSIKTEENRERFKDRKNWEFYQGDLINTTYPSCDLLICRHTLNHLSATDVIRSLINLKTSNARLLAITQHEVDELFNEVPIAKDTPGCIDYRPIDLKKAPLNMPDPWMEIDDADAEDVQIEWKRKFSVWKKED